MKSSFEDEVASRLADLIQPKTQFSTSSAKADLITQRPHLAKHNLGEISFITQKASTLVLAFLSHNTLNKGVFFVISWALAVLPGAEALEGVRADKVVLAVGVEWT